MQQDSGLRTLQQDAYRRGGEVKQAHVQARRVLTGVDLLTLAVDYAHLLLFKESQHSWGVTNLYERAGLRMRAFWRGYENGPQGAFDTALPEGLPDKPRRMTRRRGMHRSSAPRGT